MGRQDLDLYPIPERQIILPVNMRLDYSTSVTFRSDDAPEAETKNLVGDMVRLNTPAPEGGDNADAGGDVGAGRLDKVWRLSVLCFVFFFLVLCSFFVLQLLDHVFFFLVLFSFFLQQLAHDICLFIYICIYIFVAFHVNLVVTGAGEGGRVGVCARGVGFFSFFFRHRVVLSERSLSFSPWWVRIRHWYVMFLTAADPLCSVEERLGGAQEGQIGCQHSTNTVVLFWFVWLYIGTNTGQYGRTPLPPPPLPTPPPPLTI